MMNPDLLQKSQDEALRQDERRKTASPPVKARQVCPLDGHRLPCDWRDGFAHPTPTEQARGCKC